MTCHLLPRSLVIFRKGPVIDATRMWAVASKASVVFSRFGWTSRAGDVLRVKADLRTFLGRVVKPLSPRCVGSNCKKAGSDVVDLAVVIRLKIYAGSRSSVQQRS